MNSVAISPKYQVVIPKSVRELLHLVPGQRVQVIPYEGRVEMVPERNIAEMRGFLKGMNTAFEREGDRV
jgi:AbrB family looped-hinge helix DNA binding protein